MLRVGLMCIDVVEAHRLAYPRRQVDLAADGDCHGHWHDNRIGPRVSKLPGGLIRCTP